MTTSRSCAIGRPTCRRELGRPVAFVQRRSYREVSELLLAEKLDAAWICGFPYVRYRDRMRLLAVPTCEGEPLYRSYVIVPSSDQTTQSIGDLGGKIYAFSDPDSNSGWLVPNSLLFRLGKDAATFFRKSFFTWGHRRVVDAVAVGLAQGGSVDGYVWDTLKLQHPGDHRSDPGRPTLAEVRLPPFRDALATPGGRFQAAAGGPGRHADQCRPDKRCCASSISMASRLRRRASSTASPKTCECCTWARPCSATSAIATRFRPASAW